MRRILITGGTGFVGAHLANLLKTSDAKVFLMSSHEPPGESAGVRHFRADISNADEVRRTLAEIKPEEIYHLAAISAVNTSWSDPRQTFNINVIGSYNLFDAAMSMVAPARILNVSTSQVYARSSRPLTECDRVNPDNPYAATKAMAELLTIQYKNSTGGSIVTVRPFNHSGPGQSPNFVLSSMAKQFAEIKLRLRPAVLALGNLDVKRDFTDVRDVVRAYRMLMEEGEPGEIYNVCSGTAVRLRDVVTILRSLAGVDAGIETDVQKIRSNEVDVVCGDPSKIRGRTGWVPDISLERTVEDILNYWMEKSTGKPKDLL